MKISPEDDIDSIDDKRARLDLLNKEDIDQLEEFKQLENIGLIIDLSSILLDVTSLKNVKGMVENKLQCFKDNKSLLYYFLGGINSAFIDYYTKHKNETLMNNHIENAIISYRLSIQEKSFSNLNIDLKCRIYVNMANLFSRIGRIIEAIEYWKKALSIDHEFGMAILNLGHGYYNYTIYLYDPGQRDFVLRESYHLLNKGIKSNSIHKKAFQGSKQILEKIEKYLTDDFLKNGIEEKYSFGYGNEESKYRKWILNNTLYLNSLNDINKKSIAGYDFINMPNMIDDGRKNPLFFNFYNQLKQEYISSRYYYYMSVHNKDPHFSDKDVRIIDTLDYSCFSYNIENIKICFRVQYSILDKIAYFINEYFHFGIKYDKVTFRTLWYNNIKKKDLRKEISYENNRPLYALFWLSKDLFEKSIDYLNSIEPDAKDILTMRNFIEHKHFVIHENYWNEKIRNYKYNEDFIFQITKKEFEIKTMKLIKLVRAALIYLSSAIYVEERKKNRDSKEHIPIELGVVRDEWKDY